MRSSFLLGVGILFVAGCKSSEPTPMPPVKENPPPPIAKTETPPPNATPSTTTPPPKTPNAPIEAQILLDPYILGAPLTGRVVGYAEGQNLGTLMLAVCTSDEWRRAQGEGRPPISMETKTVDLDRSDGNRFEFGTVLDATGGLMVYSADPDTRIRVLPAEARPRQGGPLDNAGVVDGVGTTGQGAPVDSFNPALRGTGG